MGDCHQHPMLRGCVDAAKQISLTTTQRQGDQKGEAWNSAEGAIWRSKPKNEKPRVWSKYTQSLNDQQAWGSQCGVIVKHWRGVLVL